MKNSLKKYYAAYALAALLIVAPLATFAKDKGRHHDIVGHGHEKGNNDKNGNPCKIIPWGHFTAPGWLKKHHAEISTSTSTTQSTSTIISNCKKIPPGILKKLGLSLSTSTPPTSTTTVTLPTILNLALNPTTSTIAVSWTTNVPATTQVSYGTSTNYGFASLDGALTTTHSFTATGLNPGTTYHFLTSSRDALGNSVTSTDQSVTTQSLPDTTPPAISGIGAAVTSTTATVSWTTNESATSKVYYSNVLPIDINATTTLSLTNNFLVASHTLGLSGLTASTTYGFVIESRDAAGNVATSSPQNFTTGQ